MKLKKTISYCLCAFGMMGASAVSTPASAGLLGDILTGNALQLEIGVPIFSVGMEFDGYVTMLADTGVVVRNSSYLNEPTFHGWRTPIKGKMVLNYGTGGLTGAASFEPFLFFNTMASGHDVTFRSPNTLLNLLPTNTLLLGNMGFDFGSLKNIPVSIVLDIGQLTTAIKNTTKGQILKGLLTAESDNTLVEDAPGSGMKYGIPMGPVLVGTTSYDTTDIDTDGDGVPGPVKLGTNPSGTTPLIEDGAIDTTNGDVGIGGSPIRKSQFTGFSPNFDIVSAKVTCLSAILSCSYAGLKLPISPTLSAQPLAPLLKLLP